MPENVASGRLLTVLAAVLALTALVYWPGLDGPLLLDDRHNLSPLAAVGSGELSAWDYVMGTGEGGVFRPVSRAAFLANWWVAGDDVGAFKAVNLAVHLLCGVLVFALARSLMATRVGAREAAIAAIIAATAWLLAPLLVSTVLYTVQRMAQLSALFTLAGLLAYVHARRHRSRAALVLAFAVAWPLAVLSKENGVLLALLALLIEAWWFPEGSRRARLALLALAALPALAALAFALADPGWLRASYQHRDFTLAERLITQPRVLADYLGNLLLLPGASPMGVLRDDYVASSGLLHPPTTLAAMIAFALALAIALAARRTALAPAGFGLLFFVAAHAVESGPLPLDLYFEHRNYLPAFGICLALGSALGVLATRSRGAWAYVPAVALTLLLATLTLQRVLIWSSEESLYTHAARTHPRSARAQLGLASAHYAARRFDEGDAAIARAGPLVEPRARVGLALQRIAARCVASLPAPDDAYRAIEDTGVIGRDLYTVNALAWTAGAVASGRCTALDRARLRSALARATLEPAPGDPARERLRAAHLARVLSALAGP